MQRNYASTIVLIIQIVLGSIVLKSRQEFNFS